MDTEVNNNIFYNNQGFTLLEMLLVVGLIAILASIVILAINPGKQLAEARNAQRRSDVNTILEAIYQYAADNNGTIPETIPELTGANICATDALSCAGLVDLSALTQDEVYLVAIPRDPDDACASGNDACYEIYESANGRVTVTASYAELDEIISITR